MANIEVSIEIKEPIKLEKYRLYLRNPNGKTRGELNRNVLYILAKDYCDFIQVIPSSRWVTFEEIVNLIWQWELKNQRVSYNRTRKAIEDGLEYLISTTVVQKTNE